MSLALQCAARGRGSVEPNPMVGAVLAREGKEIARGWHRRFGEPHAEIEAIEAARAAGADPAGSTLYVSLEPCCHHGKTPPCTEAIVAAGVRRVVVAMEDPDPQVRGRGLAALRTAGVEVCTGICEAPARALLAAYAKLRTVGRPWVICKWAQTACGRIALPAGQGRWISGEASRQEVHRIRAVCDGVLVGVGTVAADDPLLTCRTTPPPPRNPTRVVLDSHLRLPTSCQLVATAQEAPVIVATTAGGARDNPDTVALLQQSGVEVLVLPAAGGGVDLAALLDEFGRRQWTYLLVEGGARVLRSFLMPAGGAAGGCLADELRVFVSPQTIRAEEDLPRLAVGEVAQSLQLGRPEERRFEPDRMLRYVIRARQGASAPS